MTGLRARWDAASTALGWLAVLPGVCLHEATHALVGRLFGAHVSVEWRGRPVVTFTWPPGVPNWRVTAAQLAPSLAAPLAVALGVIAVSSITQSLSGTHAAAASLLLGGNLLAYVVPSRRDLAGAKLEVAA